jgi:hypothetical protein
MIMHTEFTYRYLSKLFIPIWKVNILCFALGRTRFTKLGIYCVYLTFAFGRLYENRTFFRLLPITKLRPYDISFFSVINYFEIDPTPYKFVDQP